MTASVTRSLADLFSRDKVKKKKKTTDSILKDIFDPIGGTAAKNDGKAKHPMSSFNGPDAKPSEPVRVNRIETILNSTIDKTEQTSSQPKPQEVAETFQEKIEEVQQESLLFHEEPKTPEEVMRPVSESLSAEVVRPAERFFVPEVTGPAMAVASSSKGFKSFPMFVVGAFIAGMFCGLGYFFLTTQISLTEKKIASYQKELSSLQGKSTSEEDVVARLREQVASVTRQRQTAGANIGFVQNASYPRTQSAQAMVALSRINRGSVWFENISCKNKKLFIRGLATDQGSLVKLVNAINAQSTFKNAHISSIEAQKSGLGKTLYAFEVYADV